MIFLISEVNLPKTFEATRYHSLIIDKKSLNKNLDAISALIILEDYCKMKFTVNQNIDFKTWLK